MPLLRAMLLGGLAALSLEAGAWAQPAAPELLASDQGDGLYVSDAAYFAAPGPRAAVLTPDAVFDKESWYPLARALQARGVAAIALSGDARPQIRAALQRLARRGHKDLALVGAGSGAGAVLRTIEQVFSMGFVTRVVVIAPPSGGRPIDDPRLHALIIAADGAPSRAAAEALFAASAEPKTLAILGGAEPGQFLLFGPQGEHARRRILAFLAPPAP